MREAKGVPPGGAKGVVETGVEWAGHPEGRSHPHYSLEPLTAGHQMAARLQKPTR